MTSCSCKALGRLFCEGMWLFNRVADWLKRNDNHTFPPNVDVILGRLAN